MYSKLKLRVKMNYFSNLKGKIRFLISNLYNETSDKCPSFQIISEEQNTSLAYCEQAR